MSTVGDNVCYICLTDVGLKSEENSSSVELTLKKKVCYQFHKFLSTFINLSINVENVTNVSKNKRQLNNNVLCCDDCFVSVQKFCKTYESFQMELLQILDGFSNLMKSKNKSKAATKFQTEFISKVYQKRQQEFPDDIRRRTSSGTAVNVDLKHNATPLPSELPVCRVLISPIPLAVLMDKVKKCDDNDNDNLNIPSDWDGDEFPLQLEEEEMETCDVHEQDPLAEDDATVDKVPEQEPATEESNSRRKSKRRSIARVFYEDNDSTRQIITQTLKRRRRKTTIKNDGKDKDYGPTIIPSSSRNSRQRYDCLMCTKSFLRRRNLLAHLRLHAHEKVYHCQVCQMEFKTRELLTGHQTRVHRVSTIDATTCEICFEEFDTAGARSHHLANVHGVEKKYSCEECGKKYTSLPCLLRHKPVHQNKTYKCDLCPTKFNLKDHLRIHKSKVHNPEYKERQKLRARTKICEVCGKGFFYRRPLLIHKARVHGEKNEVLSEIDRLRTYQRNRKQTFHLKCPYENCDRAYNQKRNLNDHIAFTHKGEKNYVCDHCGKSYTQGSTLREHVRKYHSGLGIPNLPEVETSFKCHYENCGRVYSTRKSLKGHLGSHTGEKKFQCDQCGKSYTQSFPLKKHFQKKHGGIGAATAMVTARGRGERQEDVDQGLNV